MDDCFDRPPIATGGAGCWRPCADCCSLGRYLADLCCEPDRGLPGTQRHVGSWRSHRGYRRGDAAAGALPLNERRDRSALGACNCHREFAGADNRRPVRRVAAPPRATAVGCHRGSGTRGAELPREPGVPPERPGWRAGLRSNGRVHFHRAGIGRRCCRPELVGGRRPASRAAVGRSRTRRRRAGGRRDHRLAALRPSAWSLSCRGRRSVDRRHELVGIQVDQGGART